MLATLKSCLTLAIVTTFAILLGSTPVHAAAVLPARLQPFAKDFIIDSDGKLSPLIDVFTQGRFAQASGGSNFPDISADPCDHGQPRYVFGQSVTYTEPHKYLAPERAGSPFGCCPTDVGCGSTVTRAYAKGKTFNIGFNIGADATNLAKAAGEAGRALSGTGSFDFSYSWSETFTSTESNQCENPKAPDGLAKGQTYDKPCYGHTFELLVFRTHFQVTRMNMCDLNPSPEVVDHDATADEPYLEDYGGQTGKLTVGRWDCTRCSAWEIPQAKCTA